MTHQDALDRAKAQYMAAAVAGRKDEAEAFWRVYKALHAKRPECDVKRMERERGLA